MAKFKKVLKKIKNFFNPYQTSVGYDLEYLLHDEDGKSKAGELLLKNIEEVNGLSSDYERVVTESKFLTYFLELEPSIREDLMVMARDYTLNKAQENSYREDEDELEAEANDKYFDKDIANKIRLLEEHEMNRQKVLKDMSMLEGEKEDLIYRHNRYLKALFFIRVLLIVSAIALLIISAVIIGPGKTYGEVLLTPALIAIIFIGLLLTWAYVFRRYIMRDFNENILKQKRAAELLNRLKLRYVRYQQLLSYEYERYKVESSEVLRLRYQAYLENQRKRMEQQTASKQLILLRSDINSYIMEEFGIIGKDFYEYFMKKIEYFSSEESLNHLIDETEKKVSQYSTKIDFLKREQKFLRKIVYGNEY